MLLPVFANSLVCGKTLVQFSPLATLNKLGGICIHCWAILMITKGKLEQLRNTVEAIVPYIVLYCRPVLKVFGAALHNVYIGKYDSPVSKN